MQAALHVRWFCLAFVTYRLSSQTYSPQSECISKTSDSRLFFLIPSRHINKTFSTLINLLITLWNLKSSLNLMNLFIRYIYQKPLTFSFGVDLLNQNRPSPGQAQEYPRKTFFLYYFCYGELPKGHQSLVNSWWIAAVPEELQESKPQERNAEQQCTDRLIAIRNTHTQHNTTTCPTSDISSFQHGKRTIQNLASGQPRPRAGVLNSLFRFSTSHLYMR